METDINLPKTKSVNIFFQFMRANFYLAVIMNVLPVLISGTNSTCSADGTKLMNLTFKGSVALILLNGISLVFVWLKEPFARLEFFVMYAVNICWSGILLAQTYLDIVFQPHECEGVILAEKLIIFFHVKVHLEVLFTFLSPIHLAFRFTNLPTSLYGIYILKTALVPQYDCSRDAANIQFAIIFVNCILFGIGVPLNFILLCTRKATAPNLYRFMLLVGLIGQSGIMALIYQAEVASTQQCQATELLYRTYLYICPVALIASLTLMMTLPAFDHEEIRLKLLKQRLQVPMVEDPKPTKFKAEEVIPNQANNNLQKSGVNDGKSMYGTVINKR